MGVHYDPTRNQYAVRWRDGDRRRIRRFGTEAKAVAFAATVATREPGRPPSHDDGPAPAAVSATADRLHRRRRDGIYPYETERGTRWRFVFRQSDGSISSRRGFTSRSAAAAARRELTEGIRRGEIKVSREDFATFWRRFVRDKRPYMTPGSHKDLTAHGTKRLLPFFAGDRLERIDDERVREWMRAMVDLVEAGDLAPKTVNNARTYLSMAFNEAITRGLMARNPCAVVKQLPGFRRSGRVFATACRLPSAGTSLPRTTGCSSTPTPMCTSRRPSTGVAGRTPT